METATLIAMFISGLIVSFTGYALYTAFGQPSQQLRDPFEEHGDYTLMVGVSSLKMNNRRISWLNLDLTYCNALTN
ncbi:photosystem II reaction center protein N [Medicago truncatula]|uniref:Photosystem II reaction center protein N n=2 Tax=Medicago truncatula TaxID=3880 RepID=G7IT46_MEDTR|nr:photosystem II reaction center protein N [Medicago truncatula]